MAAKRSRSRKRSDASSQPKQPDNPVFFIDRCLGRFVVADALRAIGESVEVHHEHFEQSADDPEWLLSVGRKGWVVLIKDRHIKSNQIEIASLVRANVACFNLASADMTGPDMANAFAVAIRDMKRMLVRVDRPFVANVTRVGRVHLVYRYADLTKRID